MDAVSAEKVDALMGRVADGVGLKQAIRAEGLVVKHTLRHLQKTARARYEAAKQTAVRMRRG